MTSKEIIEKLINEKGYDRQQTERLEEKIDRLSPDIRASLENWIETGSLESPEYEGYNVEKILKKQPYREIGAFIMLDFLRRDPEKARIALNKPVAYRMTAREIMEKLINEKGYDRQQTEKLETRIDSLSPAVRAALENWIETGSLESPEYEGYNVEKILKKQPYREIGAFIMLDWLKRNPEEALKALNRPVFLRK